MSDLGPSENQTRTSLSLFSVFFTFFPFVEQEEFDQTIFSMRFRTVDEFKKPFESEDSPVRKAGLSLVSIETRMIPCPQKEKWLKDGGDPMDHARSYVPTIRRWSNATFIEGETGSVLAPAQTSVIGLVTQSILSGG